MFIYLLNYLAYGVLQVYQIISNKLALLPFFSNSNLFARYENHIFLYIVAKFQLAQLPILIA